MAYKTTVRARKFEKTVQGMSNHLFVKASPIDFLIAKKTINYKVLYNKEKLLTLNVNAHSLKAEAIVEIEEIWKKLKFKLFFNKIFNKSSKFLLRVKENIE